MIESINTNARHAVRNRYACQRCAIIESITINARHAVRNRHAGQRCAARESPSTNARHAVRDRHARQRCAIIESKVTNARHSVCHKNRPYLVPIFMPRRFIRRDIIIVMHITAAADRQHALAVQRPGQVAAIALRTAGTAVHNVRRQRRGRQERCDHQHREHEAQKSFSHMFSSLLFTIFALLLRVWRLERHQFSKKLSRSY